MPVNKTQRTGLNFKKGWANSIILHKLKTKEPTKAVNTVIKNFS